MKWYWLVLAVLTVWRLTHLLNAEDGPGDLLVRLRLVAGHGFWGSLLDCFYCLSLWIAAPIAFVCGSGWKERLLLWPALSAASIIIERVVSARRDSDFGTEEAPDVLLRSEESGPPVIRRAG